VPAKFVRRDDVDGEETGESERKGPTGGAKRKVFCGVGVGPVEETAARQQERPREIGRPRDRSEHEL